MIGIKDFLVTCLKGSFISNPRKYKRNFLGSTSSRDNAHGLRPQSTFIILLVHRIQKTEVRSKYFISSLSWLLRFCALPLKDRVITLMSLPISHQPQEFEPEIFPGVYILSFRLFQCLDSTPLWHWFSRFF